VARGDPAHSVWIEERGWEIFYTEGTEFAEVTENGEADSRSAKFGATKGTSGRVAAARL